jgi:hypothetical protein
MRAFNSLSSLRSLAAWVRKVSRRPSECVLSLAREVSSPSRPISFSNTSKRRCRVAVPPFMSKIERDSLSTSPWMRSMKSAMRSTMVSISPISTAVPLVRLGSGLRQRAAKIAKAPGSA